MTTLAPVYNPAQIEQSWYGRREQEGLFQPSPSATQGPFSIVIPPPNVTGILHMGHALNNTLQDALIRFKRMQGFAALWVPGTDHAGIATQNVVERELAKEQLTRQQLGREKFIERVWSWREQYGSTIVRQLRRLGASCDWSRERFTMDEGLSKAVEKAFLDLYDKDLIYRGYYLVNWCTRCQTALSDEEVVHEEIKGSLWHIKYPLQSSGDKKYIKEGGMVVATTRPETLLGDVAIAVHPEDRRYRIPASVKFLVPFIHRPVRVIFDREVNREFGTGAVKITPAHDFNDFQMAQRHHLGAVRVIGPDGRMTKLAGSYEGLDRFECRERILVDLEAQGLLVKTEVYATSVGHCYRCKTIVEPALTPQWFVRMKPLAQLGIEAVEKDGMRFIPQRWTKVYLDWLNNIRDWCISRQIWWGHRIPAWYCKRCYPAYVKKKEEELLSDRLQMNALQAGIHVGKNAPAQCKSCNGTDFIQDEDVLDTWFSSWLWPFSTLGWPEQTKDLSTFYPTSVLVTGQDIIFFWVARMVMAGKFFLKQIPFKDVYIHGIIRVEGGKKMSKSLGNIIDPLGVIDRMGADALRFSIVHMASEGQDLYLSEEKFLLGRNFANKLWNAARLILEKREGTSEAPIPFNPRTLTLADRWILSRLQGVIEEVTRDLASYQFHESARILYQFVWHELCDWYLEIAKLQWEDSDPKVVQATHAVLEELLLTTLRLLHPLMPFITEELWQKVQGISGATLMKAAWPQPVSGWVDPRAEETFQALKNFIAEVRNIRSTFRVPAKEKVALAVQTQSPEMLTEHERIIGRLALVSSMTIAPSIKRPPGSAVSHLPALGGIGPWDLMVPLAGLVDVELERRRIEGEIDKLKWRASSKRSRLQDATFRSKAPAEVIEEEEELAKGLEAEILRWTQSLKQLDA